MASEVRAVIDVGTNSVKLLVAAVNGREVVPLHERSHQTRLGQGFYESHLLQASAIRETAKTVAEFAESAKSRGAGPVLVIATSAARDARNKDELLEAIGHASGLEVTIISGEQEAEWAYKGVCSDPALGSRALLVMDVGGGSTEFIIGHGGRREFAESFAIGSVRLLESLSISDPPRASEWQAFKDAIDRVVKASVAPRIETLLARIEGGVQLAGTGGTSTILARMKLAQVEFDRAAIEETVLTRDEVTRQVQWLWSLPLASRRDITGLPPNRADVILPGAMIFERVMTHFRFESLRVSTRGIRFAALMGA